MLLLLTISPPKISESTIRWFSRFESHISLHFRSDEALVKLFGAIAFCQPDISTLLHLSKFLESISSEKGRSLCDQLCNGGDNSISLYSMHKIRRYSTRTCPLQIYSSVLVTIFDTHSNSMMSDSDVATDLDSLTAITISLMVFLRQSIERPAKWLRERESDGCCQCYSSIVTAVIVLVHMCIKIWIHDDQLISKRRGTNRNEFIETQFSHF